MRSQAAVCGPNLSCAASLDLRPRFRGSRSEEAIGDGKSLPGCEGTNWVPDILPLSPLPPSTSSITSNAHQMYIMKYIIKSTKSAILNPFAPALHSCAGLVLLQTCRQGRLPRCRQLGHLPGTAAPVMRRVRTGGPGPGQDLAGDAKRCAMGLRRWSRGGGATDLSGQRRWVMAGCLGGPNSGCCCAH